MDKNSLGHGEGRGETQRDSLSTESEDIMMESSDDDQSSTSSKNDGVIFSVPSAPSSPETPADCNGGGYLKPVRQRHRNPSGGSVMFKLPAEEEIPEEMVAPPKQMIISVRRPVYTQANFDDLMKPVPKPRKTVKERVNNGRAKCQCSATCVKKVLTKIFPFIRTLRTYSLKEDFVSDLVAGLTVGIMHIPQGMAYGMLTNLPPVYGLYISFFPVLIYFFFGQSRHISMGTFAVVSLMTGVVVDKANCPSSPPVTMYNDNNETSFMANHSYSNYSNSSEVPGLEYGGMSNEELMCKVGYAMAANLMVGIYQLAMGLLSLGFVTIYMSEPLTRAFTTGAAVYVFTSQIKHIFGITTGKYNGIFKLVYTYRDFFTRIMTTNMASLLMGCICMVLIYINKQYINPRVKPKIKMPFPMELIVIIIGTVVAYFGKFEMNYGLKVVGEIPSGIPPPQVPPLHRIPEVATDAIGIAIVAFAINISLSQLFGKRHNYEVPANPELVAYGLTNIITSFFNCYTSAASLSRSLVQEGVGGKTQVTGLVSCMLLIVALFGLGPLFQTCPTNVLAAIVIINLKGLFMQFLDLKRLWRISRYDFAIWLVTFIAVIIMDVDLGLFVGIGFSLLTVVFRTQSPYTCIMGRLPHTDIYKDRCVYKNSLEITGIKIFRFEASLYYANSEHFVNKIFHKCGLNPRKLKAKQAKMEKKRVRFVKDEEKKARKAAEKAKKEAKKAQKAAMMGDPEAAAKQFDKPTPEPVEISEAELDARFPIPEAPIESIIIDCSAMSYVDSVGVTTLGQTIEEYNAVNVEVTLAGCKAGVREMLKAAGFFDKVTADHLFPSIHDAVIMALKANEQLRRMLQQDVATMNRSKSLYNVLQGHSAEPASEPVFIL